MDNFRVKNYKMVKDLKWQRDSKILEDLKEMTVKCKCNKSITFVHNQKFKICSECGRKVYNTTRAYFKYRLRGELANEKRKDNT